MLELTTRVVNKNAKYGGLPLREVRFFTTRRDGTLNCIGKVAATYSETTALLELLERGAGAAGVKYQSLLPKSHENWR